MMGLVIIVIEEIATASPPFEDHPPRVKRSDTNLII